MSGIEFRPEDMTNHRREVVAQFERKVAEEGNKCSLEGHDFSRLVDLVQEAKERASGGEGDDVAVTRMFTKHVTLGNLFAVASAIGSGFAVYYGIKDDLKTLHNSVDNNTTSIHDIVTDRDKYRLKYLPMIEQQDKVNDRQDNNMTSLRDSIIQLRDSVAELAKMSRETHEDMAVMKSTMQGRDSTYRR